MRFDRRTLAVPATLTLLLIAAGLVPDRPAAWVAGRLHASEGGTLKVNGPAACSAKECHGSQQEKEEGRTIHNEYTTWIQKDKHAKSYSNLVNDLSKKIAKAMGIADAQKADRCLTCHANNVPKERQGEKFDISDGNSCDDCHGPSEKYKEPHPKDKAQFKSWTRAQSITAGMTDTLDLAVRADMCVKCHLAIDHDMLAAGHPAMSFELDSFTANMNPHWKKEKPFVSAQAWAAGQALCLRDALKQLAQRTAAGAPKIYLDEAWKLAWGYFTALKLAGAVAAAAELKPVEEAMTALAASAGADKDKVAAAGAADFGKTVTTLGEKLGKYDFNPDSAKKVMADVAAATDDVTKGGLHAAEQVYFGLDSLYRAYRKTTKPANSAEVRDVLDRLFKFVEKPETFQADGFVAGMKDFAAKLK